jgi:deoxyribodipyrimidine photolyase-related protein
MKVLVDENDGPLGGRWSFDEENRKKLPAKHQVVREPWCANADLTEARAYVQGNFSHHLGTMDGFRWPVTRVDSQRWLVQFVNERLDEFGIYEDAIAVRHAFLYHSAITPMLNIGLLDPSDVVAAVLARQNEVPMNSLEGFVRQVIGWREFMAGIYRFHGRAIRVRNFWGFTRPMPQCFYDGTSGIGPVDRVIRQVLTEGYCHHIERLMVLGNFFLLCRIRPDDVYRWFMEMFVDSYDWVMVPNVYGMSQFADGGTFTTKPYLSGSNYVKKMSDEPSGDWCSVWDGLFWIFITDHREFFLKNPRLSMMVRTWDKQSTDKQVAHREVAEAFLARLDG